MNLALTEADVGSIVRHQVDAAQGAEEMVEQLTDKTLQQEENLQQLVDEKADLVSDWIIISVVLECGGQACNVTK